MTREEAIKNIKEHCYFADLIPQAKEALDMAIEALEREPKSEWQKDHEILKAYSDGANGVLDDVSAEIEEIETYDGIYIDRAYVLQIINKYRTESEEQMPPERDCVNCVYSKDGHISFSETCHNCIWENQFIPKFMPKRIKASDIQPDDEWMQENEWDEVYKAESDE